MPALTRHSSPPLPPALRWAAVFCALTVWLLGLFAVSSQLHGSLHAEAGHAAHTCAITLFSEGIEDSLTCAEFVVTPALFPAGETTAVLTAPPADVAVRLPPGCGPPLC